MNQKILTYFHPIDEEESVFSMDNNISGLLQDGWRIESVTQNVFTMKKQNTKGEMKEYNVLAITVLYEQ